MCQEAASVGRGEIALSKSLCNACFVPTATFHMQLARAKLGADVIAFLLGGLALLKLPSPWVTTAYSTKPADASANRYQPQQASARWGLGYFGLTGVFPVGIPPLLPCSAFSGWGESSQPRCPRQPFCGCGCFWLQPAPTMSLLDSQPRGVAAMIAAGRAVHRCAGSAGRCVRRSCRERRRIKQDHISPLWI